MDPKALKIAPPSPHDLGRGALVDGRYKVIQKLGTGGSAVVYEAEHARTGRRLALKMLLDPGDARRLEQEARATVKLRSLHVPRVVDLGNDRGTPYLVMTLLEGVTLRKLLSERKKLSLRAAANIVLQVTECLDEAHRVGLVHRDLKPDNIHLRPIEASRSNDASDGEETSDLFDVTVLDFGVVKMIADNEASALTQIGSTVGTPYYMSLEQLRGAASIDGQSDVYSLSVVLYEALTGTVPFTAATLGDLVFAICSAPPVGLHIVRPDLPAGLSAVVMSGLASKREDRPASMRAIAEAFLPHADPAFSLWLRGEAPAGKAVPEAPDTITTNEPAPTKAAPNPAASVPAKPPALPAPLPAAGKPAPPRPTSVAAPGGPMFGGAAAKIARPTEGSAQRALAASGLEPSAAKIDPIENDTTNDDPKTAAVIDAVPASTTRVSGDPSMHSPAAESALRVAPVRVDRDTPTEMFVKGVHGPEDPAFQTVSLEVPPELSPGEATAVLPAQLPLGPAEEESLGAKYAFVPPPTPSHPGAPPVVSPEAVAQLAPQLAQPFPTGVTPHAFRATPSPPQLAPLGQLRSQTFGELVKHALDKFRGATPKQQAIVVAVAAAIIATCFSVLAFALFRR